MNSHISWRGQSNGQQFVITNTEHKQKQNTHLCPALFVHVFVRQRELKERVENFSCSHTHGLNAERYIINNVSVLSPLINHGWFRDKPFNLPSKCRVYCHDLIGIWTVWWTGESLVLITPLQSNDSWSHVMFDYLSYLNIYIDTNIYFVVTYTCFY